MIWLDEPYPVRLESGFEALVHGFYRTDGGELCAMVVDEDGHLLGRRVQEIGIDMGWRYDRQDRKWVNGGAGE